MMSAAERAAMQPRPASPSSPRPPLAGPSVRPVAPPGVRPVAASPSVRRVAAAPGARPSASPGRPAPPVKPTPPAAGPLLKPTPPAAGRPVPPAKPPASIKPPGSGLVGRPTQIQCPDGTSRQCSAGTLHCYANSPFYCNPLKPSPPKPKGGQPAPIQCPLGPVTCDAGNLLCFDFSPQICPQETEALDSWAAPKPFPEDPAVASARLVAPAPTPCVLNACAALSSNGDRDSCLCAAQSVSGAAVNCLGKGSGSYAAQAVGFEVGGRCPTVM